MHHDFDLAGRRVRLWQRTGEGYGHVLLKALGFVMFVAEYPNLQIESRVGLRYKPDLVALNEPAAGAALRAGSRFRFWGECGLVTMRKVAWLLKHGDVERLALFKLGVSAAALARELRGAVEPRYRAGGRLCVFNFVPEVADLAADRRVRGVPESWYTTTVV